MRGNGRNAALFLCGCGPNIAEHVDLEEIREWATERLGPTFIETHDLLCSPAGREMFRDSLANSGVDFAVVAACTPKMHELTFRTLAAEAGLNQAHVQIANLREQCAWVTKDRAAATEKAKALILAAFRRAEFAEPLESPSMEVVTDLIVIGGGVAGIEAALTASQAGRKVTLVERDISLGGGLIRSEEVAPTGECSPCLLAPRLSAVRDDPNIEVVANAEVTEVLGFYGNFTAKIRKRPRYVQDSCIGCAACFEECPVEVESSFHLGLSTRKAIHVLFPGSAPAAAAIDVEHCLHFVDGSCEACVPACPFSSIDFDEREEEMTISAGAVIVATGVAPAGVDAFPKLAHGLAEDVYTLPEFDRLACSNGPTGGKILTRAGRPPASVAFVHCAGSLREDGVAWCSGTCCAAALQAARLTRRQLPDAAVVQIHGDLVLPGPGHARLLGQAREEGVTLVRCSDVGSLEVESAEEGIWVRGKGIDPVPAEMVVL
ncbi:MAG: FAD-dependent oxidoreductase, partial [Planctomycetota bacterium]